MTKLPNQQVIIKVHGILRNVKFDHENAAVDLAMALAVFVYALLNTLYCQQV